MARIGKKPIQVPDKVKVSYTDRCITVSSDKGVLSRTVQGDVDLEIKEDHIHVVAGSENRKVLALQGLYRSLVNNMVQGVSTGFSRSLEINGIGYRVELNGQTVVLNIGYSHPINFELPDGVTAKVEKNVLTLASIDKELLGQTAASIRKLRPPEPYKGRGIKYTDEHIQRKAGKTK
ncbi:50S ribosomal protein L6 [Desulfosudis oleivorans]|uniref:Large ribosomal subunit protein uL6 n=1 Tax=Desulfosudis oleivorans (strain DSM 6200 / JCM 39069 / Hxd3) TaxID=96561 RepID=RL6_DESOH|nr:50S ribosomal protein L6 [Desulfosudis oleivorans]A8ZV72.1 RecName: Full=Large ribosomal subunit protein uL6; AltName: Full=50S ribosomal protein L6 [Desulfosudis oleivorans Hxd3]ABW66533.1 ribosomal protein L6 [Desulfosudis oleivorans Hxd3]